MSENHTDLVKSYEELWRVSSQEGRKTKTGQKHPGGRPTKYKPEMCEQAKLATGRGFTDKDLAKLFGVDQATINRWKHDFPEFCKSLQEGKEVADDAVEKSLFERATGYSHPDVHASSYEGRVTLTPVIKHYPPDTAAAFIWLKNRRPRQWRDRQEIEHKGLDGFLEFLSGRSSGTNRTDGPGESGS